VGPETGNGMLATPTVLVMLRLACGVGAAAEWVVTTAEGCDVAGRLDGGGFEDSSSSESDKVRSTATTFRFAPAVSVPLVRGAPMELLEAVPLEEEAVEVEEVLTWVATAGEDRLELGFEEGVGSELHLDSLFEGPVLTGSQLPSGDRLMSMMSLLLVSAATTSAKYPSSERTSK